VIFVTALNDTTDRVKAIEAGGDDFLTKPHNRLVLGARVRSLLKLKHATDSLEDTLRKLREAEKMRDDLMKMIVHDLKTPLTSVLASMEMLIDGDFGDLNEEQRKMLADAEGKAEDLLALIGDLLEVARIEEATMSLDLQPIAPAALLNEIVNEWSIRFQQESAKAAVDVSDDAPVFDADKPLLKRVLGNLVSNALTHSASAVTLTLSARREDDSVLFTVADNGPGIPAEYHEVIFRKFERVKNPNIPRTRSSGLGLAFCKLVVDAHGGRIWVQSAGEGKGSAFHFSLPIKPEHAKVRVTASGTVPV
jgi:signal transduction histidine kinase